MSVFWKDVTNLAATEVQDPYDVCIIGSGPAGSVVARDLVKNGARVIMLESGTGMAQWLFDKRVQDLARYTFSGNTDYPLTKTKARLLGGNSNFWTGRCERLHPSDFETHAYTPAENPWPIGYHDLDAYYSRAEKTLNVRGGIRSAEAPPRDDSADPLKTPRTDIGYLKRLFGNADVQVDHSPTATPTKTFRFFNIQREVLAEILSSPNFALVKGATVTKLETDDHGVVTAAVVQTLANETKRVNAKRYVVCCGGIESARLLLLSKSEKFPEGLGNLSGMVGRGFNEHPAVNFYSRINHSPGTLWISNKIGRTHQFYSDYRDEGLGSVLPVFRQAWLLPHHVMPFRLKNVPKKIMQSLYRVVKPTLYMGVTIEQSIEPENRVSLSEHKVDHFGNPVAHLHFDFSENDMRLLDKSRELCINTLSSVGASDIIESEVTWSRHHQGTCRMGDNPSTSVVDKNLKVHGCRNLYVGGCETFVTGGAMQPVLTTVALAHRLSTYLQNNLNSDDIDVTSDNSGNIDAMTA